MKSHPAHLCRAASTLVALLLMAGCSSAPPVASSPEPYSAPAATSGPLGIYGHLERKGEQNLVHVFINGTEVIAGPLSAEYEGTNHGRYGSSEVRSECSTKRLNLHDFRVTCDVYLDDVKESSFGF